LLNNKTAVAIPIFQTPGANALELSKNVRAKMEELKKNFPEGMDYSVVYDPTVFVRHSIEAVIHTLLRSHLLVVIVVIIFLQTWRAAIIPLAAVPVSLIGTFTIMLAFGFSINALSLFGLVLAIGIVVDDAIVVVENVERNIARGLSSFGRGAAGHERGHRTDCGDGAGAVRGVRADGLHQRLDRPVLQTVRADDRDFHGHLRVQFADAFPALCAVLLKDHHAPKDWLSRVMEKGPSAGFSIRSTACSPGRV
jgi:multidrug efflux pump